MGGLELTERKSNILAWGNGNRAWTAARPWIPASQAHHLEEKLK